MFVLNQPTIPPVCLAAFRKAVWLSAIEYLVEVVLEGYSRIRKISASGRNLLGIDIAAIEVCLVPLPPLFL
jgi:hypothetical protein